MPAAREIVLAFLLYLALALLGLAFVAVYGVQAASPHQQALHQRP